MKIKAVVADAGLLLPEAGTVCLEKFFPVDLWLVHNAEENMHVEAMGWNFTWAESRAKGVGSALVYLQQAYPGIRKNEILFLSRRVNFIGRFTAGAGTTCGEWTRPVDSKGRKGFFKGNPAIGVCPVECDFCYLRGVPFNVNSLALNVGEYAEQVGRWRRVRNREELPKVINLAETGGPIEWAVEYGLQEWIQALTDATLEADVIPYWLTKRAIAGVDFKGAHVGVSINPWYEMSTHSPGADSYGELIEFLARAGNSGASTVVRLGPIFSDADYRSVSDLMWDEGLDMGRITVDLLRYSTSHPHVPNHFQYRAHKWQESPAQQRAHLEMVRNLFPYARITGCKLDPRHAVRWVREGLIEAFPCACWV